MAVEMFRGHVHMAMRSDMAGGEGREESTALHRVYLAVVMEAIGSRCRLPGGTGSDSQLLPVLRFRSASGIYRRRCRKNSDTKLLAGWPMISSGVPTCCSLP